MAEVAHDVLVVRRGVVRRRPRELVAGDLGGEVGVQEDLAGPEVVQEGRGRLVRLQVREGAGELDGDVHPVVPAEDAALHLAQVLLQRAPGEVLVHQQQRVAGVEAEAHDAGDVWVGDLGQELDPVQDQPQLPLRLVADPLHRNQGAVVEHAGVHRAVNGVHGLLAVEPLRCFLQLLVRELLRVAHAPEDLGDARRVEVPPAVLGRLSQEQPERDCRRQEEERNEKSYERRRNQQTQEKGVRTY